MERVLASLQARHIDRIAAGYAVGGWLLVQAAAIAMPSFSAPPWAMRALILFVLLGFPCTLALSWFAMPQLQLRQHVAHPHRIHIHLAALLLCGGAAVFAVGALALQLSHLAVRSEGEDGRAAPGSIAVLPFVNMSGDPGKEFFSDGVSEELLNDLANVPALRVAARTSSFAFKGRNIDIKTIGHLLAVGAVLEGSVRESGAHLRITAQLIDAVTGYHLWSAIYDRNLTDVLDVQDEIARALTAALTHKLLPSKPGPRPGRPSTIDAEAYRDYLRGLHEFAPRTEQGTENALVLFEQVTARAPDFAEGYAALGRAMINTAEFHPERKDLLPAAEAALARALSLDPRCVGALASRLDLSLHTLDWAAARADANRLQAINPNSANVLHEMFRYYQFLGFPELALAAAKGAVALDQLSFVDHLNAGVAYYDLGRYGEAGKAAHAALALVPAQPSGLVLLCASDARAGNLAEAQAVESQLSSSPSAAQGCAFDIALGAHNSGEAQRILANIVQDFPKDGMGATEIGGMYAAANDASAALIWFDRAYDQREIGLFTIRYDRTVAPDLFAQPGWQELTDRPLYKAWQSAHDRLANELAGSSLAD